MITKLFQKEHKRAQISMQFNWIFVIIVGAIILAFFFTAIKSGSKASEQKISVSLAKHFDTILFTTGQTPGTLKTYDTPLVTLKFTCDDKNGFYNYKVGDLKVRDTKYDILFAPDELTGKSIITWTQKWKIPFTIGTFMYITNKDNIYLFYKDSSHYYKQLITDFPQNISKYIIENDTFPTGDLNFNHYTYVLFADQTNDVHYSDLINEEKGQTTIVILQPAKNDLYAYGDVFIMTPEEYRSFSLSSYPQTDLIGQTTNNQNQQGNNQQININPSIGTSLTATGSHNNHNSRKEAIHSGYLGKASFFGALFSTSKESYECNMRKGMHSLTLLTILQLNKIHLEENSISQNCKDSLGLGVLPGPLQTLSQIQNITYDPTNQLNSANANIKFDYHLLPQLYALGLELQTQNDNLQLIGSCPAIY